jgi:ABC-type sugar transport system, permease component
MTRKTKTRLSMIFRYTLLIAVGFVMLYPLLWMFFATFKSNSEMFSSLALIPKEWDFSGYQSFGKMVGGQINLPLAMLNTYKIVLPKMVFTVLSSTIVAYGFAKFRFPGRNFFFGLMISTLFLPQVVLNAPQYVMFNSWGWLNSYKPLIIPSLFAVETYFVFLLIQFARGIPNEIEEAARIDGANIAKTLWYVVTPMLKPAIVSCALFTFMWSSNDFMGPLVYLKSVRNFPVSIFLKMTMDADAGTSWNRILASSLVAITPSLIVFLLAQKSFVDGISAGGVKG